MVETGRAATELLHELGLEQVRDEGRVEAWCREAIAANEKAAAEVRAGKEKAIGALVGHVMKASGGQADPKLAREVLALPRVAEALVGRMAVLTLWPLSQGEIAGRPERFLETVFSGSPPLTWPSAGDWAERVARGGFPPLVLLPEDARREWFAGYVRTLIERDVRDLAGVQEILLLKDLLSLLAERTSALLNLSELARTLGRPRSTVEKYFRVLERLFLVFRLPAWGKRPTRRLTRAPKVHLVDTGLAAFLQVRPRLGSLLESFVVLEVLKQVSRYPEVYRLFHYRNSAGQEVDLVVEGPEGLVGIEVKSGSTPSPSDFKGLKALAQDAGDRFVAGYLIYPGERALPFGDRFWALPLVALWV